ncbi:MAG: FlgD immunoglobulin-like domain containing protein, partial [Candidatus Latescibacterota bacterium]
WINPGNPAVPQSSGFVSLAVDANNTLWGCSWREGVLRFDGWKWKWYTVNDGLLAKRTSAVAVDSHNRKWFATEAGVCVLEDSLTAVSDMLPALFALHGNYPNPFNPDTLISFTLPIDGKLFLTIYTAAGQEVRSITFDRLPAGRHEIPWDGRDGSGAAVSSGVYLYQIRCGKYSANGRMALIK